MGIKYYELDCGVKVNENIYQSAREGAGITQEMAAELFGISVESVRAYECGKRIPPDPVVIRMIEVYHSDYLGYQHLKYKTKVGNLFLPEIQEMPLPNAVLHLVNQMYKCAKREEALIEISMDGKIMPEEEAQWRSINDELSRLCTAILAIQFAA